MKFPYTVIPSLSEHQESNFKERFGNLDYDRSVRENVWRRHQVPINKEYSCWREGDARRRIIHYRDRYGLRGKDFALIESYLYFNIKNTHDQVQSYSDAFDAALKEGGWEEKSYETDGPEWTRLLTRGNLIVRFNFHQKSAFDVNYGWPYPENYHELEMFLWSDNFVVNPELSHRPWHILKTIGIRVPPKKGNPTILKAEDLKKFFPAQVEIGCGPSISAGVPALNFQHKTYGLAKPDETFVFESQDDNVFQFLSCPEEIYERVVHMQRCCVTSEPNTPFYSSLKRLYAQDKIVGPIISNNFDGLLLSLGLKEIPLRPFDRVCSFPAIRFHNRAKALFVVGCHADRRSCQQQARNRGLPIVFIDPEGYDTPSGFRPYPLEAPQDSDFVVRELPDNVFAGL